MGNLYSQKEYSLLYGNRFSRKTHVKINLYNENDVQVDSLEGIVTSGNVNLSADSAYRRTGSLTVELDKKLLPNKDGKIWFDKRIELLVGLEDWCEDVVWYPLGKYAIQNVSADRGVSSSSVQFNLLDYMAYLDGTLAGYISHEARLTVESGVSVNDAIKAVASEVPKKIIEDLEVDGVDMLIPYDMEFSPNSTLYEIVKDLVDLYKSQEFYFDLEGVMRVRRIRDRRFDVLKWDFTVDNMDLAINYKNEFALDNVKNSVHVWGAFEDDTSFQHYWVYRNRWHRSKIEDLKSLTDKREGDICHIDEDGTSYCWQGEKWVPLDFRVATKFNMENIGEKIWSESNDKIVGLEQLKLRAEYEMEKFNHFGESVSFSCLPIYVLDVNDKIRLEDSLTGIKGDYLINSIGVPLNTTGMMSIDCSKINY